MIASSSTFRPYPGRVIRDLLRLLNAVYGIVQKHTSIVYSNHSRVAAASSYLV